MKKAIFIVGIVVAGIAITACGSEFNVLFDNDNNGYSDFSGHSATYRIFWTESGGSIKKASTDGSSEAVILTVTGTPMDLELYVPDQKIYWTEDTGSDYAIKSAGIDGSDEETFISYDSTDAHGPTAIAIDPGNAVIYWNRYQYYSGTSSYVNDIWRSALSSASPVKWLYTLPYYYTCSIALDAVNGVLYFNANTMWDLNGTLGSGHVGAMYTGDTGTVNTYSYEFYGSGPPDDSVPLRGIAVDVSEDHVYYVDNDSTSLVIKRRSLSLSDTSIMDLVTAQDFGIDQLALDLDEGMIYWTSRSDNSIYRAYVDEAESGVECFKQLTSTPLGIAIMP